MTLLLQANPAEINQQAMCGPSSEIKTYFIVFVL
jgi:hypothetical protein